MYLTYEEYVNYGGALDDTAFEMYEFEASAKVDYYTFDRLKKDNGFEGQSETTKEAVKRVVYKLISLLQLRDESNIVNGESENDVVVAGISSQSNDGVSVSYNVLSASEANKNAQTEIDNVIKIYLSACRNSLGQKLLYRGIYKDE